MSKKAIVISIAIFLLGIILICGLYGWFLNRQERVQKGLAWPNFPYSDYTVSEWNKMFPQYVNENVKTIQTPEQTYAKFISALKKEDFVEAVKCCFKTEKQSAIKTNLSSIDSQGYLKIMISDLSNISFSSSTVQLDKNSRMTYFYNSERNGKKIGSSITFIKDQNGVWLIESL